MKYIAGFIKRIKAFSVKINLAQILHITYMELHL